MLSNLNIGYDTVQLNLDHVDRGEVYSCNELVKVVQSFKGDGPPTTILRLRGLTVKVYPKTIKIVGSLASYRHKSNVRLLSAEEFLNTLDELSTKLSLDLRWAKIRRLDYALTVGMNDTPSSYLKFFFPTSKYRLDRSQESSIYIQNRSGSRTTHVYDKSAESDVKGNLLRIENRYKGPVGRLTNTGEYLLAEDLGNPSLEKQLLADLTKSVSRWLVSGESQLPLLQVKSRSDLTKVAERLLLQDDATRERLLRQAEQNYSDKLIDRNSIARLRKVLRCKIPSSQMEKSELDELHCLVEVLNSRILTDDSSGAEPNSSIMLSALPQSISDQQVGEYVTNACMALRGSSPQDARQYFGVETGYRDHLAWRRVLQDCSILTVQKIFSATNGWRVFLDTEMLDHSGLEEPKKAKIGVSVNQKDNNLVISNITISSND